MNNTWNNHKIVKTNMLLTYIGANSFPFGLIGYGNLHRMYNESCPNVDHYSVAIGADKIDIHSVGNKMGHTVFQLKKSSQIKIIHS